MHVTPTSSIVAVATHPDDVKNYAGLMLRGIRTGARVSVLLVTNGENLGGSATKEQAISMGETRKREVLTFLDSLGIDRSDIYPLGVPNTQSRTLCAIRDDFYRIEGWPWYDSILCTDEVIYEDAYRPRMPFFGESLVAVMKELLVRTRPTHVLTHHPKDDHFEHRAVAFLTRQSVAAAVPETQVQPELYGSLVYHQRLKWPPAGDTFMSPEVRESPFGTGAVLLGLTEDERRTKQDACNVFIPTLSEAYIGSYMKRDEIFWSL